jgi:hypothetical protein
MELPGRHSVSPETIAACTGRTWPSTRLVARSRAFICCMLPREHVTPKSVPHTITGTDRARVRTAACTRASQQQATTGMDAPRLAAGCQMQKAATLASASHSPLLSGGSQRSAGYLSNGDIHILWQACGCYGEGRRQDGHCDLAVTTESGGGRTKHTIISPKSELFVLRRARSS